MLIIGAGNMAREYISILQELNISPTIVGRSEVKTNEIAAQFGLKTFSGGIEGYLSKNTLSIPAKAIVAVNVDQLASCAISLIEAGVKSILLEKPGGVSSTEIAAIKECADNNRAKVYIAYNRRYLSSVQVLKNRVLSDGGVTSMHFEFTEWAHVIENLDKSKGELSSWLIANSSHVIDLAFYISGKPVEMSCFYSNPLEWHPSGGTFTGSGKTESGALFSYIADWGAAGRWSLEVLTSQGRYRLCPLETLSFQKKGTIAQEQISLPETSFKPGLYDMVSSFIKDDSLLPTISEQLEMLEVYNSIGNY